MYAFKMVPFKGNEHDDSSVAEAGTLACGGRNFLRYSVQDCLCSSIWKIHSCQDMFIE